MLNYQNIISSLGEEQKIKYVTDIVSLNDSVFGEQRIPKIKVGYVNDYLKELFVKPSVLSYSYDRNLYKEVASNIASKMASDGVNFAVSFGPKPKLAPLSISEVSEDLFINVELSTIFAKELSKLGIVVALDNLYIEENDLPFIDSIPNRRFLAEAFIRPYLEVCKNSGCFLILSRIQNLKGEYESVNVNLQKTVIEELSKFNKAFLISVESLPADTVRDLNSGVICLKGGEAEVVSAVKNGHKLEEEIKNDTIDISLVDSEVISKNVITNHLLDEAVDRAIDFVYAFSTITLGQKEVKDYKEDLTLIKNSVLKSSVLLKNEDNIIPLKQGLKVSLIGDLGYIKQEGDSSIIENLKEKLTKDYKIELKNTLRGYDINEPRSERLLNGLDEKVKSSDVIIVFLGLSDKLGKEYSKNQRGVLPANQTALIKELLNYRKKVIVVLDSDYLVNAKYIKEFSSLLILSTKNKTSSEALLDILTGNYSPNGKLSSTIYDSFERFYVNRLGKNKQEMKIGPLFGYREYVSNGLPIDYHFGYGLSLSDVIYKRVKVIKDSLKVKVKLKNKSKLAVDKVVEVYVGLSERGKIEPIYTLCGYERVNIKPRSSKTAIIEIKMPYTYLDGEFKVFDTKYAVYVGDSSRSLVDVKSVKDKSQVLDYKPNLEWSTEYSYTENLVDYYESISNIREKNYMLEAKRDKMKRTKKNLIIALGSIVMAVAILMFNSLSNIGALFLNIVAGILGVTAIAFFILDISDRNKAYKNDCKKIDDANNKLFVGAKDIKSFNAEKMFNDEFDVVEPIKEENVQENKTLAVEEDDFKFVNKTITFKTAINDYISSASESGVVIDNTSASVLFASLAGSKLIAIDNMQSDDFNKFMYVTNEYFSVPSFVDYVYDGYPFNYEYQDENGNVIKSNVISGIEEANKNKEKIYLIGIDNVKLSNFSEYFAPLNKYVANPKKITKNVKLGPYTLDVPDNVWFVINISSQDNIKNFDIDLARGISIDSFNIGECEATEEKRSYPLFTCQQLSYLASKTVESVVVPEEAFKKLDKLELFATGLNNSQFGNKLSRAIEKQIAILVEAENTVNEAIDMTLASKIVPFLFIELKEFNLKEEGLMDAIDNSFGEENVTYAHSKIENYSYYSSVQTNEVSEYAYTTAENGEYNSEVSQEGYYYEGEDYAGYYSEENPQE